MISYIRGRLVSASGDKVTVDVGGIGFGIYVTARSAATLPKFGDEVTFHTYMNVREDDISLYGFDNTDDLEVFSLLLGVGGIGPKSAMGILSNISADELKFAVMSGDTKKICRAPGVGKKTAEKLIIELRDRIKTDDILPGSAADSGFLSDDDAGNSGPLSDAVSALTALGYDRSAAAKAVRETGAGEDMTAEEIIRLALRHL